MKSLRYASSVLVAFVVLLLSGVPAQAAPPPLQLDAQSAVLLDFATGQVLFDKDADIPVPPASLTKLMTLHLAYKRIAEGGMKPTDKVQVRPEAWAARWPDSSVMFLEPGQNVTVAEIMKGIAIPSGNDASVALAQHMAGSVEAFVDLMNKEAQNLGYKQMRFTEPAGLSPNNVVTAREFADFARRYVEQHPEALAELHAVKEFRYPLWENLSPQSREGKNQATYKPIEQYNRNGLLGAALGVDGLKTGFIDESGYNIALTAKRGEMRLVAVILGVRGRTEEEGARKREEVGAALLAWGFQNFATVRPPVGEVAPVRVWKGAVNQVTLEPQRPPVLTVSRGQENRLTRTVHQETSINAPVKKGDRLGELIWAADGKEVGRISLVASADVKPGGLFKRLFDSVRLTVSGWFKKK